MTSWNWSIFLVTGLLRGLPLNSGEFTGYRWIPCTKANDAELWCFLWSAPEPTVEQTMETPSRWLWSHCNDKTNGILRKARLHLYSCDKINGTISYKIGKIFDKNIKKIHKTLTILRLKGIKVVRGYDKAPFMSFCQEMHKLKWNIWPHPVTNSTISTHNT